MSHTSQTRTGSDYTRVFSDANANLPDRSVVILHVPTVSATYGMKPTDVTILFVYCWISTCFGPTGPSSGEFVQLFTQPCYNKNYQQMRLFVLCLYFLFLVFSLHVSGFHEPIIRGISSCCFYVPFGSCSALLIVCVRQRTGLWW